MYIPREIKLKYERNKYSVEGFDNKAEEMSQNINQKERERGREKKEKRELEE